MSRSSSGSGRPAPAVILLHGFCGSQFGWQGLKAALAARHRVLTPDWPGFGDEAAVPAFDSIEAMSRHVLSLADAAGLERFAVVGHSMSGFVVQQLLLDAPARLSGAVLYGAGLTLDSRRRFESAEATLERLLTDGVPATVARIVATWFVDGEQAPAYAETVAAGLSMNPAAARTVMQACRPMDFRGRLGEIDTPTLVIAGSRDRTYPPELVVELANSIPGAELALLPWCAHAAHLESPERFAAILGDFLSTLS
ncbi:MAG: alpha/beta fold hydrolase [Pigmentiphaga sp.]